LIAFSQLTARAATLERALVRTQAGATVNRQNALDFGVRTRYDVNTYQLTDSARGGSASIGSGLDGADVSTHEDRHITRADILFSQQCNIRGFDHRVSGFHSTNETFGLNHSECF
jgi:hypothetical protein